jgi:hypothetical protein
MNSNALIGLFLHNQNSSTDKPVQRIKRRLAARMVERGVADWRGDRHIQFLPAREIVVSSNLVDGDKQGWAYESAAIDTSPQFFQGGLHATSTNRRNASHLRRLE